MIKNILEKISKNEFSVKLEEKHLLRLQKYCESIQLMEKSRHWALKSNHKLISFKKNAIIIKNNPSGFDRSYKFKFAKKNLSENYKFYKRLLKRNICNLLGNFNGIGFNEFKHFDKNWPDGRSHFNIKNIINSNILKYNIQKIEPFWYFNELYKYIKDFKKINYLEIGPGSGDLVSIIKDKADINQIFTIDLAENIPFSFLNIITNFPDSSYLLPNEILNEEQIRKNEFIFLDTKQVNLLPFGYFDIAVNTASMGEMDKLEIKKYFDYLRKGLKKNNIFLNINRVEKEVFYKNKKEYLRFFEYPWDENDENLKYEISNINIGKNVNNAFIKIVKLHTQ